MRFILDEAIAVVAFLAITLSITCIIAHNNALLAPLVSNNFAETKSNVFKRISKENLHNLIKPVAYSEFLEDLGKQILNDKPDDHQKDLTLIPLAPACVVIRVLTPYTLFPAGPFIWRIFWILLWSVLTYFMLAIFKIIVGLILRCLANWYANLQLTRK
ncbi:hypothetical protein BDA96_10G096500 [Sorghum bicolor]|uniref:Uncharacterized protein n=2 Tax=Sorghum bicolor TaxID=4558 RepID=A0A194YHX8_SORBI|nr:hypothetical protein BDA96_10G096500 [Sorghum bicolor]KXG19572.1 hypothetical protein SORBI_3010G079200 [Sorghum bicolor]